MPSLYRRLLGDQIDQWPDSLRVFHDVEQERSFEGTFRITRGRGWLRRFLCWMGGLPPEGDAVPIQLQIVADGQREHWRRQFGQHKLDSVQWLNAKGELMEKLGPVTMAYQTQFDGNSFTLETGKAWLFGWIRLPLFLAPTGKGIETGLEGEVQTDVRAKAPLLGELIRYQGSVRPCEPE